jgi:PilZ domain
MDDLTSNLDSFPGHSAVTHGVHDQNHKLEEQRPSCVAVEETLDKIARRTFGPGDIAFEERRRHARSAFNATQRVAPYTNGQVPPLTAFRSVECHDLSCGGLSYFLNQPPLAKEVVLALTIRGEVKFFSARIVRTVGTLTPDGLKFLVGCQFVGRLQPDRS